MAVPKGRIRYIRRRAQQLGLDPDAIMTVAAGEGLSGGIGDGGHAFGPFQMNDAGGVLTGKPRHMRTNKWAWSNAGINYALKGIARVSRGLKGENAIKAIITKYERPADIPGSVSNALERYRSGAFNTGFGEGGGSTIAAGTKTQTRFDHDTFRKQAAAMLLQNAAASAQGRPDQQVDIFEGLQAAREAATMKVHSRGGRGAIDDLPVGGEGGAGAKAVKMASKQLGLPYVWGGESRKEGGFDCSGLIQWAYGAMGVSLPRVAVDQGKAGRAVKYRPGGRGLKKGDLIVARDGHHVVMYAGNGRVIAAPSRGKNVQYQSLSSFPPSTYHARRIMG